AAETLRNAARVEAIVLDRDHAAGNFVGRQCAAPDDRSAILDRETELRAEHLLKAGQCTGGRVVDVGKWPRERAESRNVLLEVRRRLIDPQRRLERGDGELPAAHRAMERVARDRLDPRRAAGHEARLRTAEHLVAAE